MRTTRDGGVLQAPLDPQWADVGSRVDPVITVSASCKFYQEARSVSAQLRDAGFRVYTPDFEFDETRRAVSEQDKRKLTREFMEKVRLCSYLYVLAVGGYVGRSVCLEIGYAFSRGKKILLSELPEELAVRALTSEVVPPSKLSEYLVGIGRRDGSSFPFAE